MRELKKSEKDINFERLVLDDQRDLGEQTRRFYRSDTVCKADTIYLLRRFGRAIWGGAPVGPSAAEGGSEKGGRAARRGRCHCVSH